MDSDKKSELDNYGVWVKKPPRDIKPEEDSFDIAADLPDFSSLDDLPDLSKLPDDSDKDSGFVTADGQDTSLTSEELSKITGSADIIPEEPQSEETADSIETPETEIPAAADTPESDTSADNDIPLTEIPSEEPAIEMPEAADKTVSPEDNSPLDIDFSLDDIPVADEIPLTDADAPATAEAPAADDTPADLEAAAEDLPITDAEPAAQEEPLAAAEDASAVESLDIPTFEEDVPASEETAESFTAPDVSDTSETVSADSTTFEEPQVAEPSTDIPDTFDQETAAFTEPSADTTAETDNSITQRSNEILEQIQKELSSLKDEISSLKNDFVQLKNREQTTIVPAVSQKEEDIGFFGNTGDDDTIALSGDELDNILNTADFTKESSDDLVSADVPEPPIPENVEESLSAPVESPAEAPAANDDDFYANDLESSPAELKVDFNNEELAEPQLDNLDIDSQVRKPDAELPSEISIPKPETIVVESSASDLMDSGDETKSIEEESAAGKPEEKEQEEDLSTIDDLYPKSPAAETDTISDTNLEYLSSEAPEEVPESDIAQPIDMSADSSATPVETAADDETKTSDSLPSDLTKDIKSVLSYMDQLLENLPDDKISEFAQSQQFVVYKKLFTELGLA